MSTLMSAALSLLRSRLQETTANEWSDAELIAELSRAEEWFARFLAKIPGSGRYQYTENITLTASSETYTISSLTKGARFYAVLWIDGQIPGSSTYWERLDALPEGEDFHLRNLGTTSSGIILPMYRVQDTTILFLPTSGSNRTLKITYVYLPTAKTSGADTLETPDQYVDVLVSRASHFALGQEGTTNSSFEQQYASLLGEVEEAEYGRNNHHLGGFVVNRQSRHMFGGL